MKIQMDDIQKTGTRLFQVALGLTIAFELFALGVLSYLGTFTRYLADDYCEVIVVQGAPLLPVVFRNYMIGGSRATNRFAHLIFVGWSEMLGPYNIQFLPALMILVWLIGLTWTIYEARKLVGIQQSVKIDFFLATALVFFSAIQAPNRFQTFFWRSSVTTHFAPVVFMFLLSGFILYQIRSAKSRSPAIWISLIVFIASFLIGGASEPVTAVMIVACGLFILYVWRTSSSEMRPALILLTSSLGGTFAALCALFLAPGNLSHGEISFSILPVTLIESFWYALGFVWDTFKSLPLPTLIAVLISGLLFFCLYINPKSQSLSPAQKQRIVLLLILVPFFHYLLIATSFAPSAYGQSYPAARARFLGRFLMTSLLIFEGALLGIWFAQFKKLLNYRQFVFPVAGFALLVFGLYPLRAGYSVLSEIESYKSWASAWDKRQADIHSLITAGEQDLAVRWLPNRYGVKDMDGDANQWINVCIAQYYGVNSIRSVPMDE